MKIKYKRVDNIITLTLPVPKDDTNTCSVCGAEKSSKVRVSSFRDDDNFYYRHFLIQKITDRNMFCNSCMSSLSAIASDSILKEARRLVPETHTAELPVILIQKNFKWLERILKPDAEETPGFIAGRYMNDVDPYTFSSYDGWENSAAIYSRFESLAENRWEKMFDEILSSVSRDEALLDELAAKFYINLTKRLDKNKMSASQTI